MKLKIDTLAVSITVTHPLLEFRPGVYIPETPDIGISSEFSIFDIETRSEAFCYDIGAS